MSFRTEDDSPAEVGVPADALYGGHMVRAVADFGASGVTMRERHVMDPVIARHLLGAMREFARAVQLFTDRCVVGLQWNRETVHRNVAAGSLDGAVERALGEGYERVAKSYSGSAG